jgi:ATP-binding cassette subfamily C protein CydD
LLLALAQPSSGVIEVGSTDLFAVDTRNWRRQVAFVPQRASFPERTTVREAFKVTLPRTTSAEIERALDSVRLMDVLRAVSPKDPLSVFVASLSAGECQRLLLARALAAPTPFLILDEPDANLDVAGIELLVNLLRTRAPQSVAIAAHNPALVSLGDEIVRLGPSVSARARAPAST